MARLEFDHKSPDGTYRKGLNSSKIRDLGWYPKIKLKDGLKKVIEKRSSLPPPVSYLVV
jgi:GDP-L-fucose synthase